MTATMEISVRKMLAASCRVLAGAGLALLLAAGAVTGAAAAPAKAFPTPEQAADALAAAARAGDGKAVIDVLGSEARALIGSGDRVADAAAMRGFGASYEKKHGLERAPDGARATVVVGDDDFPFPIPLRRDADGWRFDARAGREEIVNRRIGRNELDAIQTLRAVVDAQDEYASVARRPGQPRAYADRFMSSPGKRDGLYWPVKPGEPQSPLGPAFGRASYEGYKFTGEGRPRPYHGYLFRILSGQGGNAPGGAYDYRVNGRLVGGFAVVAWPARYGSSGVKTFLVNHDGTVLEKDLGPDTDKVAGSMKLFDPDSSWTKP